MYKYELHTHTAENDIVAHSTGAEIVRLYKSKGYDGIVITNHYFSMFYEWFKDELEGKDKKGIIDRWLKGYYSALEEGKRLGFTVLVGAEVRFDGEQNDYLVYGIEPEFFYEAPLLNRLKGLDELKKVLPDSACIVQAHPFREGMTLADPDKLFGIEVYNGATERKRNDMAEVYAHACKKPMLSGSDYHRPDNLARGGIVTNSRITTSTELIEVLKSGCYSLIKDGIECRE